MDYTQTLTDHGVLASVGSVGDAYDNALAESFVDSYKTELISDRVWTCRTLLEFATVEYVGWFNHERLHETLGDIPPAEFEALDAAHDAVEAPISGNGSVADHFPRPAERLTAPPISPVRAVGGQTAPITATRPARPPSPALRRVCPGVLLGHAHALDHRLDRRR